MSVLTFMAFCVLINVHILLNSVRVSVSVCVNAMKVRREARSMKIMAYLLLYLDIGVMGPSWSESSLSPAMRVGLGGLGSFPFRRLKDRLCAFPMMHASQGCGVPVLLMGKPLASSSFTILLQYLKFKCPRIVCS